MSHKPRRQSHVKSERFLGNAAGRRSKGDTARATSAAEAMRPPLPNDRQADPTYDPDDVLEWSESRGRGFA
jgi:hypothetical protein